MNNQMRCYLKRLTAHPEHSVNVCEVRVDPQLQFLLEAKV